mgnify:CR=1 FL=1
MARISKPSARATTSDPFSEGTPARQKHRGGHRVAYKIEVELSATRLEARVLYLAGGHDKSGRRALAHAAKAIDLRKILAGLAGSFDVAADENGALTQIQKDRLCEETLKSMEKAAGELDPGCHFHCTWEGEVLMAFMDCLGHV